MHRSFILFALIVAVSSPLAAQPAGFNYDEAKVPAYTLPPLLKMNNGDAVTKAEQWPAPRRDHGAVPNANLRATVAEATVHGHE
ncbi:MAG: hypothetical protein QM811_14225 [Pirellulales bacterium]